MPRGCALGLWRWRVEHEQIQALLMGTLPEWLVIATGTVFMLFSVLFLEPASGVIFIRAATANPRMRSAYILLCWCWSTPF